MPAKKKRNCDFYPSTTRLCSNARRQKKIRLLKRGKTCEEFLQVRLDDGGVGRLAEDLQQVIVSDEVEAGKRRSLFLISTKI